MVYQLNFGPMLRYFKLHLKVESWPETDQQLKDNLHSSGFKIPCLGNVDIL